MSTKLVLFWVVVATTYSQFLRAAELTFESPVEGTIADVNGAGSGFTHRLPGSGGALPANDPNISLVANPGRLTILSTHADINNHANLAELQAPGFLLQDVAGQDFSVSALFRDVRVPNGSDQLFLYVGSSASSVVRAGFHELNVYTIVENQGNGDIRPFLSGFNAFTPGDDVQLTFGRTAGLWRLSWENLTTPGESGSSPHVSLPWLDDSGDLYVGVLASNPGTATPFTAQLDAFSVVVIPEPSTMGLLAVGVLLTGLALRRRR